MKNPSKGIVPGLHFWIKAGRFYNAAKLLARFGEVDAELRYNGLDEVEAAEVLTGNKEIPKLVTKFEFNEAIYFNYARSLELALKSFLEVAGVDRKRLSSKHFGHDLEKIFCEAQSCGIFKDFPDTINSKGMIAHLNQLYADKFFEYPNRDGDGPNFICLVRYDSIETELKKFGLGANRPKWITRAELAPSSEGQHA